MTSRIYLVATDTGEKHLIDAGTPAQAIRHVTRNMCKATVATPREVAQLVEEGVRIEAAKGDEPGAA